MCPPWIPLKFAIPFIARLFDSDPPPVKTISPSLAPNTVAVISRASSSPYLASPAREYKLEGLPYFSEKYGNIFSKTSARTGVVAA